MAPYVTERKDLGVPGGKSLTRWYDNAQNAVHMFKRKADGLRMTGLHPSPRWRMSIYFSSFPGGKLGTRARTRVCTRAHDRGRASESRNAFLHVAVTCGCMKFTIDWLASHSRLNFSSLRQSSNSTPIIFLLSRIASNIHASFIVTIENGLFFHIFFTEVGKREGRMKRREEKKRGEKLRGRGKVPLRVAVKIEWIFDERAWMRASAHFQSRVICEKYCH